MPFIDKMVHEKNQPKRARLGISTILGNLGIEASDCWSGYRSPPVGLNGCSIRKGAVLLYRMGPQFDSVQLPNRKVAEFDWVYGRYKELVFMGVISWFINQRSHHWGAPSCRLSQNTRNTSEAATRLLSVAWML